MAIRISGRTYFVMHQLSLFFLSCNKYIFLSCKHTFLLQNDYFLTSETFRIYLNYLLQILVLETKKKVGIRKEAPPLYIPKTDV